jgi:predicted dehydrogenase
MKILRWGFLSTAAINEALMPALRMSERSELSAVASRTEKRAADYASKWKIGKHYGTYEELLEDPEVDVIYNPLPNDMHAEWTIKAAQAGKHVLCEKPMAMTPEDVDAMAQAARENNVVVAEAFMYRHHPQTKKVIELIRQGKIGEVRQLSGAFAFNLNRPDDIRWKPGNGGGSIWDVGCYPLSYFHAITAQKPEEVFGWQKISSSNVDARFDGQLRYSNGVLAQFHSGFDLPVHMYMHIYGSEGEITIPVPFKPGDGSHIKLIKKDKETRLFFQQPELYLGEVEDMADAILEGKQPLISLEESRENIAVIQALLESAQKNQPVSL